PANRAVLTPVCRTGNRKNDPEPVPGRVINTATPRLLRLSPSEIKTFAPARAEFGMCPNDMRERRNLPSVDEIVAEVRQIPHEFVFVTNLVRSGEPLVMLDCHDSRSPPQRHLVQQKVPGRGWKAAEQLRKIHIEILEQT